MISFSSAALASGEDARWIDEALRGNTAAFGNLVIKYQDRLYRSMVLVGGSREDALDVVQDAFVQAMLKLRTFQHRGRFYTWLYRIAFHLAIKSQRRKRRQKKLYAPIEWIFRTGRANGYEPLDAGPRPDSQLEQKERCRQVREALAKLNQAHLAVVVLREIDGLPYEEIAQILGLPKGTVRSRLHRARLQLVRVLKGILIVSAG